jgi:hypothetical protein
MMRATDAAGRATGIGGSEQKETHRSTKKQNGIAAEERSVGGDSEGKAHPGRQAEYMYWVQGVRDWAPSRAPGGRTGLSRMYAQRLFDVLAHLLSARCIPDRIGIRRQYMAWSWSVGRMQTGHEGAHVG